MVAFPGSFAEFAPLMSRTFIRHHAQHPGTVMRVASTRVRRMSHAPPSLLALVHETEAQTPGEFKLRQSLQIAFCADSDRTLHLSLANHNRRSRQVQAKKQYGVFRDVPS